MKSNLHYSAHQSPVFFYRLIWYRSFLGFMCQITKNILIINLLLYITQG